MKNIKNILAFTITSMFLLFIFSFSLKDRVIVGGVQVCTQANGTVILYWTGNSVNYLVYIYDNNTLIYGGCSDQNDGGFVVNTYPGHNLVIDIEEADSNCDPTGPNINTTRTVPSIPVGGSNCYN